MLVILLFQVVTYTIAAISYGIICRPNEEYLAGSACHQSCKTLHKPCVLLPIAAQDSCYCIEGYVLNHEDVCIKITDCPKTPQ
ncbi:hypothetical protein WA026_017936 [Henosepilachna vigintioctopunctata]|uniref:TIL domain-containing protein n=1 Tax=Henosepilachna vigintioctopunctata TaxID=420089 RepID=A0AAW1TVW3_9CUCU